MNKEAHKLVHQGLALIESTRYRMGISRFVGLFIDHWAYQQSGLYPPSEAMPRELAPIAQELSHLLSAAMKTDPTSDILGYTLSASGFYKQGTQFYPPPPSVSRRIASMVFDKADPDDTSFFEPCCGTGINTIVWLEQLLESSGPKDVAAARLYLEDVDKFMVKGSMLQLFHYFDSRQITPAYLSIVAINTISRTPIGTAYYAEPMSNSTGTQDVRERGKVNVIAEAS
jgi:hypothetical protein